MTLPKEIEILAPGGSMEGLKACIRAGADAIYTGGELFGARAYAKNLSTPELVEAIEYCHVHGKKLYLTVNTLLREDELEEKLADYLRPLVEAGLDAVLVQDMGVFAFIRRHFPMLPVHISTQMSVQSPEEALLLKELGAERIVPARELGLQEIREIYEATGMEIECFIHGALCYSYSGQCLMSSMIGGRSGNRGRCAQPCRQQYQLEGPGVGAGKPLYWMSLKDICTLKLLPEIIQAGVCSLKIEGRMKRIEYAAGVTAIYRKYLDRYLRDPQGDYQVDPQDWQDLMDLFNRGGFSDGYYLRQKSPSMMATQRPNHAGTLAAEVLKNKGKLQLKAKETLHAGDVLEIPGKQNREYTLREGIRTGQCFTLEGIGSLKPGQEIRRTRNEELMKRIREATARECKEKIKGKCRMHLGEPAILSVEYAGRQVCVRGGEVLPARSRALSKEDVLQKLKKTGDTPFEFEELTLDLEEGGFLPVSVLNDLRRDALSQLEQQVIEATRREVPAEAGAKHGLETSKTSERETEGDAKAQITVSVSRPEQIRCAGEQPEVIRVYLDALMYMQPEKRDREQEKPAVKGRKDRGMANSAERMQKDRAQTGHAEREQSNPADRLLADRDYLAGLGKEVYLMLPPIWRSSVRRQFAATFPRAILESFDGLLLRNLGQFSGMKRMLEGAERMPVLAADACLYTWNREAMEQYRELGAAMTTMPLELNNQQLSAVKSGATARELIVYGRSQLMQTANCVKRTAGKCNHKREILVLRDKTDHEFPVVSECGMCTNLVYNSLPTDLSPMSGQVMKLQPDSLRISLTIEDAKESAEVLRRVCRAFASGKAGQQTKDAETGQTTRGHFRRGAE